MRRLLSWKVLIAASGLLLVVLLAVVLLPEVLYPALSGADLRGIASASSRVTLQNDRYEVQNDFRGQLIQILAGLFVVAGAVAAWLQIQITREGQITERFTRAIDHLGSDKIDVRLGGIYALERIARNSPADRPSITPLLGSFIRGRAPLDEGSADRASQPDPGSDEELPWLAYRAIDVQTAMDVLARRPGHPGEPKLFLADVDLRRMQLTENEAMLDGSNLRHASLAFSRLTHAHMERSELVDADLRYTDLRGANLSRADLRHARLQTADLRNAILRNADLRGANLTDARLDGADLTGIAADDTTIWPANIDMTPPATTSITPTEIAG